jgi:hypothetical protein
LIAAPLEFVVGAGLAALALFAKSSPPDDGDDSIVDNLGDAGKEIAGRALMAGIGCAAVLGGFGDLIFGVTDPLHKSPLIRDGALVTADQIDVIEPLRSPRLTFHSESKLGTQTLGVALGFGLAHWVSDRVRLRHSVSGVYLLGWTKRTLGGATGETSVELAFGRKDAGLSPKRSIGVYGGGGWLWTDDDKQTPVAQGGVSFNVRFAQYRIGTQYTPGLERYPGVTMDVRMEVGGD